MITHDKLFASLDYEAPFVIEKLVKQRIADSSDEAYRLFTEVKRFIVLVLFDTTEHFTMHSLRVDEAWHQFVLFTREYSDFCQRYFDMYVHHSPGNAPKTEADIDEQAASFDTFRQHYEALFRTPLADVWYDEKSVTPRRRVINSGAGNWTVRQNGNLVDLLDGNGEILLSIDELAREAVEFLAQTGAFYVRELPGSLSDEEKVAIVTMLVRHDLLRVAP
jgi:hypothetical protein